jgi:DNA-binding HxlR family transcriptional regulator
MLTQQLRSLERDGIVSRTQYLEIPPRVEYSLTEIGESLNSVYGQLVDWLNTHRNAIDKARVDYDKKRCPVRIT